MGDVLRLRDYAPRSKQCRDWNAQPATVIVLPVIRIERHYDPDAKIDLPSPADPRWKQFADHLCLT